MKVIKFMPEFQCYPLWEASTGKFGNIDPATLPISAELVNDLLVWKNEYDKTLKWDDPASSGFDDEAVRTKFWSKGRDLESRLRSELKSHFLIVTRFYDYASGP